MLENKLKEDEHEQKKNLKYLKNEKNFVQKQVNTHNGNYSLFEIFTAYTLLYET